MSKSVLDSLSKLINGDSINFVCMVEYRKMPYFLALGCENFFLITTDLEKYKDPPVPYEKIVACRVGKHKTLMQIKLAEFKKKTIGFG